jgi:phosphohistidine swiveling domain-containing protein
LQSIEGATVGAEPFVLSFDEIREADAPLVGGKGLHLAELARAGLRVPAGFCLTTAAYRAILSHNGLAAQCEMISKPPVADEAISTIHKAILAAEIPADIVKAVTDAYAALGRELGASAHVPVAVRSSATTEDLPNASFAGQYDTFLNVVGLDDLLSKIKACWAGLWNERAIAYMRQHGLEPLGGAMGVVVQHQVPAHAAGVLFTLNPLTGREEEMLVEAVWGLGEAVVSGKVSPDAYIVDAYNERVLSRNVSRQTVMLVANGAAGVREVPVPAEDQERPVLSDEQLLRLTDVGYRVQAIYGYPQDIEWALVNDEFVVLQARPLTSFSFDPAMGQWTSANYREILPGTPSPLAMSMSLLHDYGRALSEFFEIIKMGKARPGTEWGKIVFGRPYWNVAEAKRFAAIIPGFKERTLDKTVGIEPTYEGDGLTTPWTPGTILRALPVLFALNHQYATCWKEAQAYRDYFLNEEEPALSAITPSALSDEELANWVRRMHELHWQANGTAITVSLLATQSQDDFEPMIRSLNAALPPHRQIAEGDLITGLSNVRTAQATLDLWKLARQALTIPEVAQAVLAGEPDGIPARLQETEAGRAYWSEVRAFINQYRYMAPVDEDLAEPRWDEDHSIVLSTLQAYARADESMDPARSVQGQRRVRKVAEARAKKALSRGWRRFWPFAWRSFFQHLELVRRYVWWREETRVIAARAYYHCRRFFKELGRRWARRGWLEKDEHVFFLHYNQIVDALEGRLNPQKLRESVRKYLHTRECYRNFDPPNNIGVGSRFEIREPIPGQVRFQGIPCSSGLVEGPARVVHCIEEAQALQRGEVLVAPYTNPSWTPLFNLAAAVIIEEGGLLSHGAVVAREYGIPAVLRIPGATRVFRTGQMLRVDGAAGTVEIVNKGFHELSKLWY